jgi:vibriolysin
VRATTALPEAEILSANVDGIPTFIRGDLGRVGDVQSDDLATAEAQLRPALVSVVAPFRLAAGDLRLRKINTDENGYRHFRYNQVSNGLDVIGGDLVVHVDIKGSIFAINGTARGDIPASLGKTGIGASDAVHAVQADARFAGMAASAARMVYVITPEGQMHKAYESIAEGFRGDDPVRDKVYVDVGSAAILAVHPQIYAAKNRRVYSANNTTSLPGTLRRSEGQTANSDVDVNAAYDNTGDTYDAYFNFWGRDSYNNAGATLTSSVHYSSNYCNAFWNGTQMVYGDGSGSSCLPLARAMDVTAHELTHAVTENESGLIYSGESGGLNEAMSDIHGSFAEAWVDGGRTGTLAVSADTWKIGEDILPPALRYMNDPAADGASLDFWTSGAGNVDVHYSSGIANLAFYLMSQGGTHPRGKSSVVVPGIGMDKAIRVFYKANTDIMTSGTNFAAARTACAQAAGQLGYDAATQDAVSKAWQAVGVGGGTNPPPTTTPLANGVPVTGISGAAGSDRFFTLAVPAGATSLSFVTSGGSGDADLYVKFGSQPTLSSFDCRSWGSTTSESCTITNIQTGTYYVLVHGYTSFSGMQLTGTYSTGGGGNVLQNNVPVPNLSGARLSTRTWTMSVPAGRPTLQFTISGGTGDADMYVRRGAAPTTTTYDCRPYVNGNNEVCTFNSPQSGTWYVMLRGFSAYSGVTLKGAY